MGTAKTLFLSFVGAIGLAALVVFARSAVDAESSAPVKVGPNDIGGVVSSTEGSEAGVWVIAETTHLPTRYRSPMTAVTRGDTD